MLGRLLRQSTFIVLSLFKDISNNADNVMHATTDEAMMSIDGASVFYASTTYGQRTKEGQKNTNRR